MDETAAASRSLPVFNMNQFHSLVSHSAFLSNVKSKKGKKGAEASDSDDSDMDDLDDEEVSLGSMDEEDFGDELEDEGGTFMDAGGDDDDEGRERADN